jgi:hypothetical protein
MTYDHCNDLRETAGDVDQIVAGIAVRNYHEAVSG